MIKYEKKILDNGLTVICHQDKSTPMAAVNVLYDVGSRDEDPDKTGFAHLFEHLMFGGSVNIPDYDQPLQNAGGSSNAFTSSDVTNYYDILPAENLETALWLESDRMLSLDFSPRSLEVQRSVVIEEFKQRYINQPYGDIWHLLRSMTFKTHPYNWPTIGKEIKHIEDATLDDVKDFFGRFYHPGNAVLCVAGPTEPAEVFALVEKWFGGIEGKGKKNSTWPAEPKQDEPRYTEVERDVPASALYMAWHIPGRTSPDFYTCDLITDLLGRGTSSRFYQSLVKRSGLCSEAQCYHSGDIDPGLIVFSGNLSEGANMSDTESLVMKEIEEIKKGAFSEDELKKVIHKVESGKMFGEMSVMNKAMSLCFAELLGDIELVNTELSNYEKVSKEDIVRMANEVFTEENRSTLRYKAK